MICIFLAALEVTWPMIWHPNIVNKLPQDPPIKFMVTTIITQSVEGSNVANKFFLSA
jgi:hypothetical protein